MTEVQISKDGGFIVYSTAGGVELYDISLSTMNGFDSITDCLSTKHWADESIISTSEFLAREDF